MKVYVVTSGEYSDYQIEAIFSTKALADAHIQKIKCGQVAEWVVDVLVGAEMREWWLAEITKSTGKVKSRTLGMYLEKPKHPDWLDQIARVSCKSRMHAEKLAVEARQAWLRKNGPPLLTSEQIMERKALA